MAYFSARSMIAFGNNATTQTLFSLENGVESRVNVYVRRLALQKDGITVLTTFMPIVRTSRATSISGGAIINKAVFVTNGNSSDPAVVLRTPIMECESITATAGTTIWQQYSTRMHTAVEQQIGDDQNMLPVLVQNHDFVLRPGEAIICKIVAAAGTSNDINMNSWFVEAAWEETALATFNISGTVTLSASPVSGAKVIVVEADDTSMTNAFVRDVITTGAGGTWTSTIRTGKVGAAYVQYESGGTYYTAPGSPYLSE